MTYSLSEYGSMIADRERMDPYAFALKSTVTPESVVLDIGAGPGIHALLACKFGARRVYAIEPNETVHLARELAEDNGFAGRIEFIQDHSTRVTLPEHADIIVSDLRGVLPLFGLHIPSIIDARQRHLKPEGKLIPKSDTLWAALVESRSTFTDIVKPWDQPYGFFMEPAKEIALNSWTDAHTETIRPANLLTKPQKWTTLDYATITDPNVVSSEVQYEAERDGTAHGWLIWFETELVEGIGFSCGPERARIAEVYGRGFFPLLEPVPVVAGDTITLSVEAELVDKEYEWRWQTRIYSQEDSRVLKADFRQATDLDSSLSPKRLAERVSNDRPTLTEESRIDRFVLGTVDGIRTNREIAALARKEFPTRFRDDQAALVYVYELVRGYG